MGILLWIIFGALAGWIASIIMGADARMGAIANIVVGVVGAVVGGLIMNFFGQSGVNDFNIYSIMVAIFGSVVVLWLVQLVR